MFSENVAIVEDWLIDSFNGSFIHFYSLTYRLTNSLTRSCTCPLTCSLICSFIHSCSTRTRYTKDILQMYINWQMFYCSFHVISWTALRSALILIVLTMHLCRDTSNEEAPRLSRTRVTCDRHKWSIWTNCHNLININADRVSKPSNCPAVSLEIPLPCTNPTTRYQSHYHVLAYIIRH